MKLTICWLYGQAMNIYGDRGNVQALLQRCRWREIDCETIQVGIGESLEAGRYDIYFWGGGQDREQIQVAEDIQGPKGEFLRSEIEDDAPVLAVCGGYQLLGQRYHPHQGDDLPGLGVFDAWTDAGRDRFIGNIVIDSDDFGELVGFENHSGRTILGPTARPLGRVITGHGNNGTDKTEGCRSQNAIGCYLHGALLPKNPALTDFLIRAALQRRYGTGDLPPIDDRLETAARISAIQRATATAARRWRR